MALGSTIYNFKISLSDTNRDVYEELAPCLAQHPSETLEFLIARLLAYCLEYSEGLKFSKGLADPDCPALYIEDLTGRLSTWIEVGLPSAEKLHKASKGSDRVVIYCHRDPKILAQQLEGKKIQNADRILIRSFDQGFLAKLATLVGRRTKLDISVAESDLYLSVENQSISSQISETALAS